MDSPLLSKAFGLEAKLVGQVQRLTDAEATYGEIPKFFGSFYKPIGLEFEIENIPDIGATKYSQPLSPTIYWQFIKDGSLREGVEFVSLPMSGHNIDYALYELEKFVLEKFPNNTDSIRTSIHVHVDVSGWTVKELFQLPALYALFEKVFFSFHNETRQHNPYCYAITEVLPANTSVRPETKYCALNLAPVETQLSVEFRHANYSKDMRKNRRWIQMLCKFMKYAEENKENIKAIVENTVINDRYLELFNAVLGKSTMFFQREAVFDLMKINAPWSIALLELS